MTARTIRQRVPAYEITEGAGVTVHRSIVTPALRNLDPFLLLDRFGSDDPDEYITGFPNHPPRGFINLPQYSTALHHADDGLAVLLLNHSPALNNARRLTRPDHLHAEYADSI